MMKKSDLWKGFSGVLLLYAIVAGLLIRVPDTMIRETLRNVFYHVGMWFGMFAMLATSFAFSLRYLRKFDEKEDMVAVESVNVGMMFGILGIITGMIWAKNTWGDFWIRDPKLNGAAVGIFIYLAYLILRGSMDDVRKRANVSAVYNILAFVLWIVFIFILPRTAAASIHPGQDGAPIMALDLSPGVRTVFYPAMAGWILLGIWILTLRVRIRKIKSSLENR